MYWPAAIKFLLQVLGVVIGLAITDFVFRKMKWK